MTKEITQHTAQKVLDIVDQGLCQGLGIPKPGHMCVEAAVCFALGEPHNDKPTCVGAAVREYKIVLNDANWSSKEARTKGMRRVAIAQLGSSDIDQSMFAHAVTLETIKKIVPIALRSAGELIPAHKETLETAATACEVVTDLVQGEKAVDAAADAAYAAVDAADAADAAVDAADAADAAVDAARVAAYAARAARAVDAARVAAYAARAARAVDAACAAARAVDAARVVAYAARDSVLEKAAEIAVQALIKLECEGTKWLFLTE